VVADDPVTVQPQARLRVIGIPPRPRVAEPQRGQHMQGRLVRPRVLHGDLHQQIPRAGLGIIDGDHPVPVIVECIRVDQLVFGFQLAPAGVLGDQVGVGEFPLRVVVAPGVPGMGRGAVQVPPVFLDVLSVIALWPGQPEHPLLQNRIDAIPHTERQAPVLRLVAEPGHAVFVPPVHPGPGMLVRKERPCVTVGAVVLAHGAPRPFGQVRSPVPPFRCSSAGFGQPHPLRTGDRLHRSKGEVGR